MKDTKIVHSMKRLELFIQIMAFIFITKVNVLGQTTSDFRGCPKGTERIASSSKAYEKEILKLVNKARRRRGLKKVKWNENLAHAARYHAKDMQVDEYLDHQVYDRVGNGELKQVCGVREKIDVFTENKTLSCSENIGAGQKTPQEMFKDWMKSKGHRKNILAPKTKYMGVGYIYAPASKWGSYWVQCFEE